MNALRIIGTWLRHALTRQLQSLRGRLVLTLAALAVVLLTLELLQHTDRLNQRRRLRSEGHILAASASADAVEVRLQELFRTQSLLVRSVRRSADPQAYLEDIRLQYPGLDYLQIWVKGSSTSYVAMRQDYPRIDRGDLFAELYTHADSDLRYVSDVQSVPTDPSRRFIRLSSITKDSRPEGNLEILVVMEFNAAEFPQLFSRNAGQDGELLLDGNGVGIYTHGEMPPPSRVMQEPEVAEAVRVHGQAPVQLQLTKSLEVEGYVQPISGTEWVLVFLEKEAPVAGVDRDLWRFILIPLLIVAVLGVALGLLIRISVRPLDRLSAATRTLGTGELSFRLERPEVEEFEGMVAAFNQMAERLEEMQSALVEANARLEQEKLALDERVQAATQELQEEHEKLFRAERLSTLGLFSSAIAHDLRNPLNTVSLTMEWLRVRLADHPEERVQVRIATVRRELQRADQIIRTLLGFARTGEPELAPTDVNQILREVADVVEPPESVRLSLSLDENAPEVPADRAQLFQVLENLVRNAIQAMPEGGEVRLSSEANCEKLHLRVADNGPGIPLDVQERIFEPLVTSKSTGTGLGLALAKRIVEAHHGQIHLTSRPGDGACFDIELPLHAEGAPVSEACAREPEAASA